MSPTIGYYIVLGLWFLILILNVVMYMFNKKLEHKMNDHIREMTDLQVRISKILCDIRKERPHITIEVTNKENLKKNEEV
jgi:hypothetical protein